MRNLFLTFIGFVLCLTVAATSFAGQVGLDSALEGVQKIEDLINNPERLEKYYNEVNSYYQGKISRPIFDIMIQQIRVLNSENPEVGRRLLKENTGVRPYEIISDLKTYGRDLNLHDWENKRKDLFGGAHNTLKSPQAKLQKISQQIQDFKAQLQGNKKEQGMQMGEFYKKLKVDHASFAKQIVADVFYNDEALTSLTHGNDPDLLLYVLDTALKERLALRGYPENTLSLISSAIPRTSDLLADKNLFPVATFKNKRGVLVPSEPMASATYRFESFTRPLHAVWKGIWLGECIGGADEKTTPRRWATVILDKVNNYVVEKNGGFIGFIQEVGMQKKGRSPVYYATEFGTPNLKEYILKSDPKTKGLQKRKMIDVWLETAPKNIVRVKSDSLDINNANVLGSLSDSPSWNLRSSMGSATDYQLADQSLSTFIIESSGRHQMLPGTSYGDGMISDATTSTAHQLEVLGNVIWNAEGLLKYFAKKTISKEGIFRLLNQTNLINTPTEIHQFMSKFYEANAMKNPARVYQVASYFYEKNPDILKEYGERLVKIGSSKVSRLEVAELHYQWAPQQLLQFAEDLNLSGLETRDYLAKMFNDEVFDHRDLAEYLTERAIKMGLVETYTLLAENSAKTILGSREYKLKFNSRKLEFINKVAALGPEHMEIIKKVTKTLMEWTNNPVEITAALFYAAQKAGILTEYRKSISTSYSSSPTSFFMMAPFLKSKKNLEASKKFIADLLASTIREKDYYFMEVFISTNTRFSENAEQKRIMNQLVSDLIRTQDPKFVDILSNHEFMRTWADLPHQGDKNLLPESLAYKNVVKAALWGGKASLLEKLRSIEALERSTPATVKKTAALKKETNTQSILTAAPEYTPTAPADATAKTAPVAPLTVDLTPHLQQLFAATDARSVDGVQRQIQNALSPHHTPSAPSVQLMLNFLRSTNANNLPNRSYQVMALFEIAALTAEVPSQVYESSRALAQRILAQSEYAVYRAPYADLLQAQVRKAVSCSTVF